MVKYQGETIKDVKESLVKVEKKKFEIHHFYEKDGENFCIITDYDGVVLNHINEDGQFVTE
jgi:hypothetical protein